MYADYVAVVRAKDLFSVTKTWPGGLKLWRRL
jgi:hypothetical protein